VIPTLDWMALATVAAALTALTAAGAMVYSVVGSRSGAARRLQRRLAPSPDLPELVAPRGQAARLVAQGLTPLARLADPGEGGGDAVRGRLSHAGYRAPWAIQLYLAAKAILALLMVAAVLWVNAVQVRPIPYLSLWVIGLASVGYFLPNAWLQRRVRARQVAVDRGLPDSLDLMVTCVEAGLGLDAAVQRVSSEVRLAHPVLAEELALTFLEVKAGVRRTEAFRRLADRTGVRDLKTLAATLNQTDLFGTSVAKALRVQAEGMRSRRMQRAEERAAILSVKMTFPLVLCFLPALFAVLAGPAWVNISAYFLNKGSP
jgi:tight adherence protein C